MSGQRRSIQPLRDRDPRVVGAWTIEGRIGAGGMGVVYLSRNQEGTYGALKQIAEHLLDQPDFHTRFAREIDVLRRVEGTGLAKVLDADSDADPPYVVTEYVDAANLQDHIRNVGPVADAAWNRLADGLLAAVEAIHAKGVLHRDIKPSNVLLAGSGPVLIDFGIAAVDETTAITAPQMLIGTPEWLAPERLSGAAASPASDIFSLGGLLAYAGTGRAPFAAASPAETMQRVTDGAADLAGLSAGQARLVTAMLAANPTDRPSPATARAMLPGHGVRPAASHEGPPAVQSEAPAAVRPAGPPVLPPTVVVPAGESMTVVLPDDPGAPANAEGPPKRRPWRVLGIVAGVVVLAGLGLLLASIFITSDPDGTPSSLLPGRSDDLSVSCQWVELGGLGDEIRVATRYDAQCQEVAIRADGEAERGASPPAFRQYRVTGTIGDQALSITTVDGRSWDGALGTAPVRLLVSRDEDLAFSILPGSTLGEGSIQCLGPAPNPVSRQSGVGTDLVWDNPSTVQGTYTGDDRVTNDEAGSLCSLVVVGVPASRLGDIAE